MSKKHSTHLRRARGQAFVDLTRGIASERILCASLDISKYFHLVSRAHPCIHSPEALIFAHNRRVRRLETAVFILEDRPRTLAWTAPEPRR